MTDAERFLESIAASLESIADQMTPQGFPLIVQHGEDKYVIVGWVGGTNDRFTAVGVPLGGSTDGPHPVVLEDEDEWSLVSPIGGVDHHEWSQP
jgi:hypothetical protein